MKLHKLILAMAVGVLAHTPVYSQSTSAGSTIQPFLGRWDLTLKSSDREYPSWLEIKQEDGQLKAQMVGRWSNARPLPKVEITRHLIHLTIDSRQDEKMFHLQKRKYMHPNLIWHRLYLSLLHHE